MEAGERRSLTPAPFPSSPSAEPRPCRAVGGHRRRGSHLDGSGVRAVHNTWSLLRIYHSWSLTDEELSSHACSRSTGSRPRSLALRRRRSTKPHCVGVNSALGGVPGRFGRFSRDLPSFIYMFDTPYAFRALEIRGCTLPQSPFVPLVANCTIRGTKRLQTAVYVVFSPELSVGSGARSHFGFCLPRAPCFVKTARDTQRLAAQPWRNNACR